MNSVILAVVRLCTAVGVPRRAMLRARFAPITASPVTPIRLLPVGSVISYLALPLVPRRADSAPASEVSAVVPCAAVACEEVVRFGRPPGGGLVERDAARFVLPVVDDRIDDPPA